MKPKAYIAWPIPAEVENYLNRHCDCRKWSGDGPISYEQLKKEIGDAEGLLTGGIRVDAELLRCAPGLRVVSNISAGYNNMDIEAMRQRNVIGTNNPGISDDSVADLVFGLILASARNIATLDRYVKQGCWKGELDRDLFGVDVHGATLGIIGLGGIGQQIAKRGIRGFNMNVLYFNRSRKPAAEAELGVQYRPLNELLALSDFVVVMLPLNKDTEHFIDSEHFQRMKRSAILINASRGSVVREQALIHALRTGQIRSAALDVFEQEPVDPENPLLQMDRVITLPHVGSATEKTRFNLMMSAARNLVSALNGETPQFLIREFKS